RNSLNPLTTVLVEVGGQPNRRPFDARCNIERCLCQTKQAALAEPSGQTNGIQDRAVGWWNPVPPARSVTQALCSFQQPIDFLLRERPPRPPNIFLFIETGQPVQSLAVEHVRSKKPTLERDRSLSSMVA